MPGSKFTDKHRRQFLKLLEKNLGNITRTCKQMNIKGAHETIKNWRKRYPWFDEAMTEQIHTVFDLVEANIFKAAIDEYSFFNAQAITARKFLLTYHPEGRRRGYRSRGEITGEDGGPMEIRSFVEMVERVKQKQKEVTEPEEGG